MVFNWHYVKTVIFTHSFPNFIHIIMITYAYKFALEAEMNQGVVTSFNTLVGIYIAISMYFLLDQRILCVELVGMVLMLPCIFIIVNNISEKDVDDVDVEMTEKEQYGYIAIGIALTAPLIFSVKNFFIRIGPSISNVRELSIDQMLF